jgi:hypothetical protein
MSDEIRISPARGDSGTMSCSVHRDWSASSAAPYALDACFRIAGLHNSAYHDGQAEVVGPDSPSLFDDLGGAA